MNHIKSQKKNFIGINLIENEYSKPLQYNYGSLKKMEIV